MNSSGSESEGEHFYVDYGFDGTKIAMSYQVTDIKKKVGTTHPIYDGPYTPVGTTFSGFYASNAVIYGKITIHLQMKIWMAFLLVHHIMIFHV